MSSPKGLVAFPLSKEASPAPVSGGSASSASPGGGTPATPKRGTAVRASGELGIKLGFLRPGQRSSVKTSKSELAAVAASSPTGGAPASPAAKESSVPPLQMGNAASGQAPEQKSPKSNKRFSMV